VPIAASTYQPARAQRDGATADRDGRVYEENFPVYGVRKVWRQLGREGIAVARCTVARLMRRMGLQGVVRGKTVCTTISNAAAPCPLDRVNRQFKVPLPNVL
jgi:putative transposase